MTSTTRILNLVESGDQVALELVYAGTHTGPLVSPQGQVAPTGRQVRSPGAGFIRVRSGKVASFHGYYD